MTTVDSAPPIPTEPPAPQRQKRRKPAAADRFAEQCKPLPPVPGETPEERLERLDASLAYLTQCFQDEFEVREESTLLVDVITQVLLPFAAISAFVSLIYVRVVEWSSVHFPNFERVAAIVYLLLLACVLLLLVVAQKKRRPRIVVGMIDKVHAVVDQSVPERKETLTRNNYVNRWIYLWVVGAVTLFIPLTFIMLRSGAADHLGVRLVVDTANVCDGPTRIYLFRGSETCVEIQEEDAQSSESTSASAESALGLSPPVINPVDQASSPLEANIAEVRLDTTTSLAMAVLLLVVGIPASMALWWWRYHRVRDIDLM